MAIKRAKVANGKASDYDESYLDDLVLEAGEELVDVLIDDLPDDYTGFAAWDPVLQRIYPHPDEKHREWIELEREKTALVGIRGTASASCQTVIDKRVTEIDAAKTALEAS